MVKKGGVPLDRAVGRMVKKGSVPWRSCSPTRLLRKRFFGYLAHMVTRGKVAMAQTTTVTVRVSGALSEFVAANVGKGGMYGKTKADAFS